MDIQKYLERTKLNDVEFAALVNVTPVTVGRWRRKTKLPGRDTIYRIEQITKGEISFKDWIK